MSVLCVFLIIYKHSGKDKMSTAPSLPPFAGVCEWRYRCRPLCCWSQFLDCGWSMELSVSPISLRREHKPGREEGAVLITIWPLGHQIDSRVLNFGRESNISGREGPSAGAEPPITPASMSGVKGTARGDRRKSEAHKRGAFDIPNQRSLPRKS